MRTIGALMGIAIGDALGATVEFMDKKDIRKEFGIHCEMIGGGWLNLKPGEITDDTQMTLCVARGIARKPDDPIDEIGMEFMTWAKSGPKDIGNTIRAAIGQYITSLNPWHECAAKAHRQLGGKSAGNGALMRTIYPALYYRSDDKAAAIAMKQAEMTHYDPKSTEACCIYTTLIRRLLNLGETYMEGQNKTRLQIAIEYATRETLYEGIKFKTEAHINPTGYVVDSMNAALWACYNGKSFEDAIIKAVNLGGDADTIGAIAGGIAGAFWGYENIPQKWIKAIDPDVLDEIISLAGIAEGNRNQTWAEAKAQRAMREETE